MGSCDASLLQSCCILAAKLVACLLQACGKLDPPQVREGRRKRSSVFIVHRFGGKWPRALSPLPSHVIHILGFLATVSHLISSPRLLHGNGAKQTWQLF